MDAGMDTEHRIIATLLALKDAPNTTLLDPVQAIGVGVTAARHMLFDKAVRLQHTDQQTAMECAALVNRIDALIRPAERLPAEGQPGSRLKPLKTSVLTIGGGFCPGCARSYPSPP